MNEPTNIKLKDRTYNEEEKCKNQFVCHRCGFTMWFTADVSRRLKYCASCGKKIILRSAYETIEKDILEVG